MRILLVSSIALLLCSACSEEAPQQRVSIETAASAQPVDQVATQRTPSSLSGDQTHAGPNPHAKLTAAQHIAVAQRHVNEGRMPEALDVLTRAIAENPDDPSLIGTRGSFLLSRDRVFDALVDLEKAVELAPNSAELLVNRSQAYRKFRRYEEAMADLDRAVALQPAMVAARFNRGTLLYGESRYEQALEDFNRCIEVAPDTAGPYFNRAITREALGDLAGAQLDMNRFIELSDNAEWNKVARETLASWSQPETTGTTED